MEYPKEQTDALKGFCVKVSALVEQNITYFYLEGLRLPDGCEPRVCDALLCPVPRDNYPSRLFLSVRVKSPYDRNWNVTDARIGEKNWHAFSWKVELANPTLAQILTEHLTGFVRQK